MALRLARPGMVRQHGLALYGTVVPGFDARSCARGLGSPPLSFGVSAPGGPLEGDFGPCCRRLVRPDCPRVPHAHTTFSAAAAADDGRTRRRRR